MRFLTLFVLLLIAPLSVQAQTPNESASSMERADAWRATLTIFRSPGTGVQLSKGHLAVFAGHYPTVIKRDGENRDTQFLRVGVAYYLAPEARTSPYGSLSLAPTLSKGWSNSALADIGVRRHFTARFSGQLGVAVLHAPALHETRVNPTVGFGVHF